MLGNAENSSFFLFYMEKQQQQQLAGQDSVRVVREALVHWSCPVQNTIGLPQWCVRACVSNSG